MKTKQISITIPTYPTILEKLSFENFRQSVSTLFLETYNGAQAGLSSRRSSTRFSFGRFNPFKKIPKMNFRSLLKIGFPILGVILLGVVVWAAFSPRENSQAVQGADISLPGPIDSQRLNRTFAFPVRDGDEELTRFSYTLENAELRKQIVVKGQRATAVAGRMFLVIDLKIVNEYDQSLSINTRDYVRVIINGNEKELLAPDIHNDPVEVQAISTKPTRLGVAIDENVSSIQLRVGEIDGEKETVTLDLSR